MIHDIFPVKIYKTTVDGVDKILDDVRPFLEESYTKTTDNNQGSMRNNGLCSYNAARDLHENPMFATIVNIINHHVRVFWDELGYHQNPYIFEMWTNKYVHGSFIDAHNHAPIPLTVSLYLKKDLDAGNIVFENPLETLLKHQPYRLLQDRNSYHTLFDHEVEVKTGDLVIFPGWLRHKTQPNKGFGERIMIGANINRR